MSTVAEIIEAVKELPETEKGVLLRKLDPLRELGSRLFVSAWSAPDHRI